MTKGDRLVLSRQARHEPATSGLGSCRPRQVSTSSTTEFCSATESGSGAGLVLLHDGSFEGLLSAVFDVFRLHLGGARVASRLRHVANLLEETREVETDSVQARRVWDGILDRAGRDVAAMYRAAFLCEDGAVDDALWGCLRDLFATDGRAHGRNLLDPHVHTVHSAACRVRHEAHLFTGMVRFQQAQDGSLCAVIAPEHDILELLGPHFLARLPGQPWMIADSRRGRVLGCDGASFRIMACDPTQLPRDAREAARLVPESEDRWRDLWTVFYDSVNIQERANPRQLARLLPRKYWSYLPERTRVATRRTAD